ncbi:MAG: ribosome small subunit-dependent GTPase A [Lachnospiraceae bacterium]|nr:ribosome small subunit-dependent GTPase A [Lachnospiraceae bacterium]
MKGRIIRGVAGFYDVATDEGVIYRCRAKGTFRREGLKPLAGDLVDFEITHEGDKEGNVTTIHPRKNELLRPPVVNVDRALLVFAAKDPDPSHYLINRFLVMTEQLELPVILCFNKCDLVPASVTDALCEMYARAGCVVRTVSAKENRGLEILLADLRGRTTAVAGPSGVGKSSLINALLAEEKTETGELSRKIARGKNTTRHSELFYLPETLFTDRQTAEPSFIFDTPGFMSLKPEGIAPRDLHLYYPEFTFYEPACRYAGCTHISEPDCAVKDALAAGEIHHARYEAYRLLYDELNGERPVYVKKIKQG